MNRFVLGTVQFGMQYGISGNERPSEKEVFEMLDMAYQNNVRVLDTAPVYGESESLIGRYNKTSSNQFLINSKNAASATVSIKDSWQQSVEHLNTSKLHTYFFHRSEDIDDDGAMQQMIDLKDEGSIGMIGASIYTNDEFARCIDEPAIDVIQFPMNLLDNLSRRKQLIDAAKQANKQLQVRSAFLQGLFFKSTGSLPAYLRPLADQLEKLHAIARENNLSVYELALGYVLSVKEIDEVLIGVDNAEQLHLNLSIASKPLDPSVCDVVESIHVEEEALLYPYNWK